MDAAYLASIQKTSDRLAKVAQREQDEAEAILPTTYEGYDAARGLSKSRRLGSDPVADSFLISSSTPPLGSAIMPVPTGGLTRALWKPSSPARPKQVERAKPPIEPPIQSATVLELRYIFISEENLSDLAFYGEQRLSFINAAFSMQNDSLIGWDYGIVSAELPPDEEATFYRRRIRITPATSGQVQITSTVDIEFQFHEIMYDFSCLDLYVIDQIGAGIGALSITNGGEIDPLQNYELRVAQSVNNAQFEFVAQVIGQHDGDRISFFEVNYFAYSSPPLTPPVCANTGSLNVRYRFQLRKIDSNNDPTSNWFPGVLP